LIKRFVKPLAEKTTGNKNNTFLTRILVFPNKIVINMIEFHENNLIQE
jgi:hypothetical protein